jgi:DNA-binding transcriptional ArsR family regulator
VELHDGTADLIAERFRALGEPTRLLILASLQQGERSVGELVDLTGSGQANISKHLQLLHRQGFVARRKAGTSSFYRISDPAVFELCDLVCGTIRKQLNRQQETLAPGPSRVG